MGVYYENGEKCVSYTLEELTAMQARGETESNWKAAAAMTEEEIQAAIARNPDDFEASDEELARVYRPNLGEKPPEWRKRA